MVEEVVRGLQVEALFDFRVGTERQVQETQRDQQEVDNGSRFHLERAQSAGVAAHQLERMSLRGKVSFVHCAWFYRSLSVCMHVCRFSDLTDCSSEPAKTSAGMTSSH